MNPITVVINPDGNVNVLGGGDQHVVIIDRRPFYTGTAAEVLATYGFTGPASPNAFLTPRDVLELDEPSNWADLTTESVHVTVTTTRPVPRIQRIAEARLSDTLDRDENQPVLPGLEG